MKLSIIVPIYNESQCIEAFYKRISSTLNNFDYEIIFINDGSNDNSLFLLQQYSSEDKKVKIIDLSRNFGKEIAMTAGSDNAKGDAVIFIDADLQDPPEVILDLIKKWNEGYDVVYAKRKSRKGETFLKKFSAFLFYRLINLMSKTNIPKDVGDFRLISKEVNDSLKEIRERNRFMKGIFSWIGYKQTGIEYVRDPRYKGISKFNYLQLINFAIEGITSFSRFPLQLITFLGFLSTIISLMFIVAIIAKGYNYNSIQMIIPITTFIGSLQFLAIGTIGEYLGRLSIESKNRPIYIIKKTIGL